MPRIRLGSAARTRIVAWLTSLGSQDTLSTAPLTGADIYRGGRLFEALQCQGCHAGGGIGGQVGPALDRLGWKVGANWLFSALRDPARHGLSPPSHPYILSVRDAADLSAFLIRRFTPPGGPELNVTEITIDPPSDLADDPAGGLAEVLIKVVFSAISSMPSRAPDYLFLSAHHAQGPGWDTTKSLEAICHRCHCQTRRPGS